MRLEVRWRWRIKWCGKWGVTRYTATEEQIRREHPEAIQVEGSRVEQLMPETESEITECLAASSTSSWLKKASK